MLLVSASNAQKHTHKHKHTNTHTIEMPRNKSETACENNRQKKANQKRSHLIFGEPNSQRKTF